MYSRKGAGKARSLVPLFLILVSAFSVFMLIAVAPVHAVTAMVQERDCSGSSVSTLNCSFSTIPTSGNTILYSVVVGNVETSFTVSETQKQTVNLGCLVSNTGTAATYWWVVANSASDLMTVSWIGGATDVVVTMIEISGTSTISASCGTATGTSTAPAIAKTMPTSGSSGTLVSLYANNPSSYAAGTGLTFGTTTSIGGAEYGHDISTTCPATLGSSVAWAVACIQIQNIQRIGSVGGTTASGTSVSATLNGEISVGSKIVACAGTKGAQASPSISDSLSNSFTSMATVTNTAWVQCWIATSASIGADTVTVFGSSDQWGLYVATGDAYSNQGILSATNTGTGTIYGVGSITLSDAYLALAFISTAGNDGTRAAGTGFSLVSSTGNAALAEGAGALTGASTTCSASGTTSQAWAEVCVLLPRYTEVRINSIQGKNTAPLSSSNIFSVSYVKDGTTRFASIVGTSTRFAADEGSTVTVGATSSGSTSNHQWAVTFDSSNPKAATTTALVTTATATSSFTMIYFEQYKHTLKISPQSPSTFDPSRSISIDCDQVGITAVCHTFTPANGDGDLTSSFFTDNSQIAICEPSTGGTSGQHWVSSPTSTASLGSPGGDTVTCLYSLFTDHFTTTTTSSTTSTATETQTSTYTTTFTTSISGTPTTVTSTVTTPGPTTTATSTATETQTSTYTTTFTTSISGTPTTVTSTVTTPGPTTTATSTATSTITSTTTSTAISTTTSTTTRTTTSTITSTTTTTITVYKNPHDYEHDDFPVRRFTSQLQMWSSWC